MRTFMVRLGLALAAAILATGTVAMADGIVGLPITTVDWAQEFCLTDCTTTTMTASPITQIDLIMATPGVTFTGVGPVYSDEGESMVDSNASVTLGAIESVINFSSPDSNDVFLDLNFSPSSTSTPFTFYWEQFDGSTFITTSSSVTSSDVVSWNGSSWTITPMAAAVSMPEPGILIQLALSLGLLGALLFVRRRALA